MRYSIFKVTRMGSMIQKQLKLQSALYYDEVLGDILEPPHDT